ncbi:hypothetical protein GUJ93_ZPchr0004g39417 [Zizania palustris]|uniref:Uncharacterized protein n=1 Tax=Zizania palustris TaxID=103762 RepID=A0A8J5SJ79_ZIZPA|nr:hypothetical protein GUJ93_ZPchr0004g39417 [Zizania palustris]
MGLSPLPALLVANPVTSDERAARRGEARRGAARTYVVKRGFASKSLSSSAASQQGGSASPLLGRTQGRRKTRRRHGRASALPIGMGSMASSRRRRWRRRGAVCARLGVGRGDGNHDADGVAIEVVEVTKRSLVVRGDHLAGVGP